jgi:hypothetical protein
MTGREQSPHFQTGLYQPKGNGSGRGDSGRERENWPRPNFRTAREFVAEYKPIAEVIGGGVLYSGSLCTLTAKTGTGKTAWITTAALAGVSSLNLLGRFVREGRYAICTAENPDGVRMRLSVGSFIWNIKPEALDRLLISDNRVRPEEICDYLARESERGGPFTGIFVDTWQAFFDGRDADNRTEAANYTKRFRPLTALPGSPAVVIPAHPNKNATNDDLIPSGGGTTLNEVDGNLTMAALPSGLIEFGCQGKFRGLNFEPHLYRIERFCSPDIVDVEGRQIAMPLMLPASMQDATARESVIADKQTLLLQAVADNPKGPISEWAAAAGMNASKAYRMLTKDLGAKQKLVRKELGKWKITKAGKEALREGSEG